VVPVAKRGKPVGMVTDRDIAIRAVASGRDPEETPIADIMSSGAVYCAEEDDLDRAAEAMERRQVRRVPVVDRRGLLSGIVSLGDLALRASGDGLPAEVLEEVSKPGRRLSWLRDVLPHTGGAGARGRPTLTSGSGIVLAVAFAAFGAGLMYMLDPARGRRRRALARDQIVHAKHVVQDAARRTARDTSARAQGLWARARMRFTREDVSDQVLRERVRSALGRAVSHPHAIRVDVRDGCVCLSGGVLEHEIESLVEAVSRVRGVCDVEDHLDTHAQVGSMPGL
jgi:hypothetical protein